MHERVVCHHRNGEMHHHEDGDGLGRLTLVQMYRSGSHKNRVTRTASRKNNHRGDEEIHVTIGQATHATTTPMTVSFP
jgi:hypothetical protein